MNNSSKLYALNNDKYPSDTDFYKFLLESGFTGYKATDIFFYLESRVNFKRGDDIISSGVLDLLNLIHIEFENTRLTMEPVQYVTVPGIRLNKKGDDDENT